MDSELADKEALIFCTSLLAEAIADEGTFIDSEPLGSGRDVFSCFVKYFNRDIFEFDVYCTSRIQLNGIMQQNVSHDSIYMHVIYIAGDLGNMHTRGK